MEKEFASIRFTETDNGFRVDVEGEHAKEMLKCGCAPMMAFASHKMSCCCPCCAPQSQSSDCCDTSSEKDKSDK